MSDQNRDRISKMTSTGVLSTFETSILGPYGMEWLAGGTSAFAASLMVAATFLRNAPIDLTFASGTMYVITSPSAGNRGRIYKVTGF